MKKGFWDKYGDRMMLSADWLLVVISLYLVFTTEGWWKAIYLMLMIGWLAVFALAYKRTIRRKTKNE